MSRTARILFSMLMLASVSACNQEPPDVQPSSENPASVPAQSANVSSTGSAEVKGVASYRERMAMPPDASFVATLEDVSRADAPAQVIGRAVIDPAGQPPFRFTLQYDPSQLQPGGKYGLRARVTRGGELMFSTDRHYDVPPSGTQIDMMLVRAAPQANAESASTAALENTYWKLMQLGDQEVEVVSEQREPYLVLHSDEQRVAGFGGCNRLTGSYSLSGDDLRFSQMAGTMMACTEGMEHEQAFHDALGQVARWHIDRERLELYDESGKLVARFESRYMQ